MAKESTGYVAQKGSLAGDIRDEVERLRPDEERRVAAAIALAEEWEPTWFAVGNVKFAAFGDRLLIVEDKFRSGYECRECEGRGTVRCDECGGQGWYYRDTGPNVNTKIKCSQCAGQGQLRCAECDGKGALLIIPEISQRRPSTGRIVSIGDDPKCRYFHVDDNVLYSNFAGHALELDESGKAIRPGDEAKVVLRILHAGEILSMVTGHLELRSVSHEREALGI